MEEALGCRPDLIVANEDVEPLKEEDDDGAAAAAATEVARVAAAFDDDEDEDADAVGDLVEARR